MEGSETRQCSENGYTRGLILPQNGIKIKLENRFLAVRLLHIDRNWLVTWKRGVGASQAALGQKSSLISRLVLPA